VGVPEADANSEEDGPLNGEVLNDVVDISLGKVGGRHVGIVESKR